MSQANTTLKDNHAIVKLADALLLVSRKKRTGSDLTFDLVGVAMSVIRQNSWILI